MQRSVRSALAVIVAAAGIVISAALGVRAMPMQKTMPAQNHSHVQAMPIQRV